MSKTIGILGGMGPLATADLFIKIIANTPAASDQDHLPIIINNNPKIPSRIHALQAGGQSPLLQLINSAQMLEKAGADFIIMPCNTAHIWYKEIEDSVGIPVYHMIHNAVAYTLQDLNGEHEKVLLLATLPTIETGLYQKAFEGTSIHLQIPTIAEQLLVNEAITSVKAGSIENNPFLQPLNNMLDRYVSNSVLHVLGGCTELPLLFPYLTEKIGKLDPTLMLAQLAVAKAQ
ncbi:aspartate racemase [Peribacillus deserti]|uniref:Aspartate racemase n=1 Tax=Peribacillus deserti TaxID=673318 RepID=A0A2N5M0J2_9BACI|nr:aspartate racemase [Peribacillus deserti]